VLTTGCLPFDGKNLQEMRESVCRGKYRIPFYLSDSCEKLLRKFLVRDSTKRSSIEAIADDPWIMEGYNESPLDAGNDSVVLEDNKLIALIHKKFNVDKELVLKSLREALYNDVSALYYLMYHERDKSGDYALVNKVLDAISISNITTGVPESHPSNGKDIQAMATNSTKFELHDSNEAAIPSYAATFSRTMTMPSSPMNTVKTSTNPRRRYTTVAEPDPTDTAGQSHLPQEKNSKAGTGDPTLEYNAVNTITANTDAKVVPEDDASNNSEPSKLVEELANTKKNKRLVGMLRSTMGRSRVETEKVEEKLPSEILPTIDESKPRSLRFTFNSNTTSSKPPDEVVSLVMETCLKLSIKCKLSSKYLLECTYVQPQSHELIRLEIEVCKLPRLRSLHGLKFKRLSGSANEYKLICENLLINLNL
jgi:MAP/microtubule affinity-regulating kinase